MYSYVHLIDLTWLKIGYLFHAWASSLVRIWPVSGFEFCDCLGIWITGHKLGKWVSIRTHVPWTWNIWPCFWTYIYLNPAFDSASELIRTCVVVDRLLLFCSGWTEPLWWGIACCVFKHRHSSGEACLLCFQAPPGIEILELNLSDEVLPVVLSSTAIPLARHACCVIKHHQGWNFDLRLSGEV